MQLGDRDYIHVIRDVEPLGEIKGHFSGAPILS